MFRSHNYYSFTDYYLKKNEKKRKHIEEKKFIVSFEPLKCTYIIHRTVVLASRQRGARNFTLVKLINNTDDDDDHSLLPALIDYLFFLM